ncbi:MAG: sensor histidine kinase, partial [Proteobacteria bacterium]|nr:sensor histidine kinase [Pseudomonadota bacterium]
MNPRLEDFADVIRDQRLPDGWVASVFDRQGVNIARTPNPSGQFIGQHASPSLLPHLLEQREGIVETISLEGIPLLTAFSHGTRFGWAVAIGVPRAEMTAPAVAAALRTLAVGGVALAIGLALALLVARQITRPIAVLRGLAGA